MEAGHSRPPCSPVLKCGPWRKLRPASYRPDYGIRHSLRNVSERPGKRGSLVIFQLSPVQSASSNGAEYMVATRFPDWCGPSSLRCAYPGKRDSSKRRVIFLTYTILLPSHTSSIWRKAKQSKPYRIYLAGPFYHSFPSLRLRLFEGYTCSASSVTGNNRHPSSLPALHSSLNPQIGYFSFSVRHGSGYGRG